MRYITRIASSSGRETRGVIEASRLEGESPTQFVTFQLGTEEYALEIGRVQEIIRLPEITRVPRAPGFIQGVVNLRGRILPVVDLRGRLGFPPEPFGRRTRIIVVRIPEARVGLIVDHVVEVLRLPAGAVDPAPELVVAGLDGACVKGVGKCADRLLILLDLDRIFQDDEAGALAGI